MRTKFNVFLTLMLALVVQLSFAQEKVVTGVVTEAGTGEPLPGVNVVVKGTDTGAATDFDGKYSIKVNKGQTLVFSFLGYDTVERKVGDSNVINVQLKEGGDVLETVVINALGVEVKKRTQKAMTISTVKAQALKTSGESDPVAALAGKVAGVNINLASGDPGASANITIRGPKTILLSTQPLFVVDGVPISSGISGSGTDGVERPSNVADIDPNDIKSVKILKGGAAAAIWGSRGANGVVLITTKSGSFSDKGRINVSVSSSYSIDNPLTHYDLQDTFGQGKNGNFIPTYSGSWGDKISARSGGEDDLDTMGGVFFKDQDGKKWYPILQKNSTETFNDKNYDAVINSGMTFRNGIQLSAGSAKAKYYLSIGTLNQDGIFEESSYDKTSVKFSNSVKVTKKMTISSNVQYAKTKQNAIQKGSNLSGLLLGLYRTPADFDNSGYIGERHTPGHLVVIGSHRSYRRYLGTKDKQSPGYNNPLFTVHVQENPYTSDHVVGGIKLGYDLTDKFKVTLKSGGDYATSKSAQYFPVNSGEDPKGSYSTGNYEYTIFTNDIIGQYSDNLSDDLIVDALVGVNFESNKSEYLSAHYRDFLLNTDVPNTGNAISENRNPYISSSKKRKMSVYTSNTFTYKEMLFATITGRAERSSTYADIFFYPSVSLAYDFAKLDAFKDSDMLNSGTVRASWSVVGNEPRPYLQDTYFVSASDGDGWGSSWSASSYSGSIWRDVIAGNPDIKPETTKELEFGLDLRMLKNRFNFGFTYYNSNSTDLILYVRKPASSGIAYRWENAADMTNKGVEIETSYDIISKDNFKWTLGGTYTKNKNEVTDLAGTDYIGLDGFSSTSSGVAEGYAFGILRSGDFKRDDNGNLVLNSDGFAQHGDKIFAGDPNPDFKASLYTNVSYKGLKLRILGDGSFGGQSWDGTTGALTYFGRTLETANEVTVSAADAATIVNYKGQTIDALPYATLNSDGTYTVRGNLHDFGGGTVLLDQAWYRSIGGGFGPVGTQFFKDATWIKLREVTLGYTLRADALKKAKISSIEFGVTGRNLYLWTKDDWYIDPETNLSGSSRGRGLQYFNHPTTKSFIFSTKINF